MTQFPTIQDLSNASPDEVNRLWAGLGYYSRAQRLLQGAKVVMEEYGGRVPENISDLRKIPGVGPYTAGAIASIAYDKCEPLVDGNVVRVLSRLRAIETETGPKLDKICWEIAADIVDPDHPSAFNQALMELGATVCKPTNPACGVCPVRSLCKARELAEAEDNEFLPDGDRNSRDVVHYPVKAEKKKPKELSFAVCVLVRGNESEKRFLFVKRPSKGLLAGQWEFPRIEIDTASADDNGANILWSLFPPYLERNFRIIITTASDGINNRSAKQVFSLNGVRDTVQLISHVFSHQVHRMHVVVSYVTMNRCETDSQEGCKWMTAAEIADSGITSGCKKVLDSITCENNSEEFDASGKRKRRKTAKDLEGNTSIKRFLHSRKI